MTLPVSHNESRSDDPSSQTLFQRLTSFEHFTWRVLGGIFAVLLVIGWIFIVIVLIQEEKWQLVLIAWLLLYSAAHFCYWYFKKHNLLPVTMQFCRGRNHRQNGQNNSKTQDSPPTYEDVMKSEHPPPAYWSIVLDSPKYNAKSNSKFSLFSLESIPNVFKSRPNSSKSQSGIANISGTVPAQTSEFEAAGNRHMSSRSNRSSLVRDDSLVVNGNSTPIVAAIYDNMYGYPNAPNDVPHDRP